MDSLYFYGLLALGGLCAHLYEYPPHEFHTLPHLGSGYGTYPPVTLTQPQPAACVAVVCGDSPDRDPARKSAKVSGGLPIGIGLAIRIGVGEA